MSIRKLPSGKFQATVRMPNGKRTTKTDALRGRVATWERELRAAYARGEIRDPRAGRITVSEWYGRWFAARGLDPTTLAKIDSCWRTHCEPRWGAWPMDAVTHMEAQEWARSLELKRRARHRGREADADAPTIAAATVHETVNVMSSLFRAAVNERPPIVLANPFTDLDLPKIPPTPIDFLSHEEAAAIVAELERSFAPQWSVLVEMGLWVGLRPGELFGLHGDRVAWLRHDVEVTRVMTRHGLREYPKSMKSHRVVPMPAWLTPRASTLMVGRPRDALVFTAARGGPINDSHFRHRVWVPALAAAGVRPCPPRAMRHTAASWLVMDGVDLYRVQALLGHESYQTTQRYAHLAPAAHDKIRESWRRMDDARRPSDRKASG